MNLFNQVDKDQSHIFKSKFLNYFFPGQLEFVNGGWSMPDEACTHYNSLIDQSTLGLKRLNQAFGECGRPKVTWQIDPFGHSKELASLYAQMGYDAIYFAREDYQDRYKRQSSRELEHVWISSADLGNHSNIFAGMMQMGYGNFRNYKENFPTKKLIEILWLIRSSEIFRLGSNWWSR